MMAKRFSLVLLIATLALWVAAGWYGFLGNTVFIGHVSMAALAYSAWSAVRADSPSDGAG